MDVLYVNIVKSQYIWGFFDGGQKFFPVVLKFPTKKASSVLERGFRQRCYLADCMLSATMSAMLLSSVSGMMQSGVGSFTAAARA